jgi:hypothetical protein
MGEQKPSNNFNVKVKIEKLDIETEQINLFYVFRNPLVKHGSFSGLVMQINMVKFAAIDDYLQRNIMLDATVDITFADPSKPIEGNKKHEPTKKVINKSYKILACKTDENATPENQMYMCRLILVNPVLFDMQKSNGFNKILKSTTAMEGLNAYEYYLKEQYGDTTFEFKKIGCDENLNSYIYEHIHCRKENDLQVPDFFLQQKKALNSFSYYFFDDFRIDKGKEADICGLHINLIGIDPFTLIDIQDNEKNPDAPNLDFLSRSPQFNPFSPLAKLPLESRIVGRDPQGRDERNDDPGPVPTSQLKTTVVDEKNHTKGRDAPISTAKLETKDKPVANVLILNNPDSVDDGLKRFDILQEQFADTIRAFHIYNIDNCYPDLYQFDRRYNLDVVDEESSKGPHIPIAIVNIFRRDPEKTNMLKHSVRLQTIKLKTKNSTEIE